MQLKTKIFYEAELKGLEDKKPYVKSDVDAYLAKATFEVLLEIRELLLMQTLASGNAEVTGPGGIFLR